MPRKTFTLSVTSPQAKRCATSSRDVRRTDGPVRFGAGLSGAAMFYAIIVTAGLAEIALGR